MTRYLFVGERPSQRALAIGATWRRGGLSATVLHRALRAMGLDPQAHRYTNVFVCATGEVSRWSLHRIRQMLSKGYTIVALGAKVSEVLTRSNIPFVRLVHPAARGRIRNAPLYNAHVAATLLPGHTLPSERSYA